jgi:dTDP-4-amino-4,6-dideoxygalactose transaminase
LFYTYGEIYDGSHAVSHYVPLHSALAGRRYTRAVGLMSVTDALSDQLICLPMWIGLTVEMQERVVAELLAVLLHVESV